MKKKRVQFLDQVQVFLIPDDEDRRGTWYLDGLRDRRDYRRDYLNKKKLKICAIIRKQLFELRVNDFCSFHVLLLWFK